MIEAAVLSRLALFADLQGPQLQAVAELMDEESQPRDTRVLREGISGVNFYVITDGEAAVRVDGKDVARLHAGDFFGEISILTGDPVLADVVAASDELRLAVLPGPRLRPLLLQHPALALRMLETMSRRLRATTLAS